MTTGRRIVQFSGTFLLAEASMTRAGFVSTNIGNFGNAGLDCSISRRRVRGLPNASTTIARKKVLQLPPWTYETYLASVPPSSTSTIAAGGALALSSIAGIMFEKTVSKSSGGHVITLLMAAFLSNVSQWLSRRRGLSIGAIPTEHFLYDWCWSVFLPASLVFALLSSTSTPLSSGSSADDEAATASSGSNQIRSVILGMALPFAVGSIGSIIGCIVSYCMVSMPYAQHTSALIAGCLCASYIGGTVNFFATAKLLKENAGDDAGMGSAFGSMAAADLVVMALYFAMLSAVSKSSWLQRLFPSRCEDGDENEVNEAGAGERYDSEHVSENTLLATSCTTKTSIWPKFIATILASAMALISVWFATGLEQRVTNCFPPPFNIPGTLCAFLACFGLMFERLVKAFLSHRQPPSKSTFLPTKLSFHLTDSVQKISDVAPSLSNICFYLLFSAVGTSADLSSAVAGGPQALTFASLALLVHFVTVVTASWTGVRLVQRVNGFVAKFHWPSSGWEEVLTASNAAIGGPSTAAAFAVGLISNTDNISVKRRKLRNQYRSALVIAATFWGVFGYAIATGIGVAVTRWCSMHWR